MFWCELLSHISNFLMLFMLLFFFFQGCGGMDEEVGGQEDGKEVRRVGRGIGFVP